MKLSVLLLALAFYFSACAKTVLNDHEFSFDPNELNIPADGQIDTILIESPTIWTARSSANWIKVTGDSLFPSGKLILETSPSLLETERNTEIQLYAGAETLKLPVVQQAYVHPAFRDPDLGPLEMVNGNEKFDTLINTSNLMIARISGCGDNPGSNSHNVILLNESTSRVIANWNHISSQSGEWEGVHQDASAYQIPNKASAIDQECSGVKTLNMILVKKYGDWDHQHSNGLIVVPGQDLYLAGAEKIIIDLYYDSQLSHIPQAADLTAAYGVSGAALQDWDKSRFNLDIQIHTQENTHLALNLELEASFADQWLRVEIPISQLAGWNADKKPLKYDQVIRHQIKEISFTAETSNRLVYRNLNMSGFSENTPKLFKELGIRIKRIEIVRNEKH